MQHQLRKNFTHLVIGLVCVMLGLIALSLLLASRVQAAEDEHVLANPVSINALMVTLVDHSAHYIWDYGAMERAITEDEWRMVEYYAIQLAGSGSLITVGGTGSLDDTWVRDAAWTRYSADMIGAAQQALLAAERKDGEALLRAGNTLTDSCLNCHDHFKPGIPTEGLMHQPDYDYLYHLFR